MIRTFQKSLSQKAMSTLQATMDLFVTQKIKNIHTSTIGIIESFDATTQTANIQPAIQFLKYAETATEYTLTDTNYPLLTNVPVHFPSGGDWHLTFPVSKGDECLLIFNERSIGNWRKSGSIRKQNVITRSHSMLDAIAIVGIKSKPNILDDFNTSSMELRNTDSSTKMELTSSGINITGDLNVGGDVNVSGGDVTADGISLKTHIHTTTATVGTGPVGIISAPS